MRDIDSDTDGTTMAELTAMLRGGLSNEVIYLELASMVTRQLIKEVRASLVAQGVIMSTRKRRRCKDEMPALRETLLEDYTATNPDGKPLYTVADIIAKYDCSPGTLYEAVRASDSPPRILQQRTSVLRASAIDLACKLYEHEPLLTIAEICKICEIKVCNLHTHLNERNVPRRRRMRATHKEVVNHDEKQ